MDYILIGVVVVIVLISAYIILKSLNTLLLKSDMLSKIEHSIDIKLSKTQAIFCRDLYVYCDAGQNLLRAGVVLSSMVLNYHDGTKYVIFNVKTKPIYLGFFNVLNTIFQIKRNFVYYVVELDKCIYNQKVCFVKSKTLEETNFLDTTYFYEPELKDIVDAFIKSEFNDIQLWEYYKEVSKNEVAGLKMKNSKHLNVTMDNNILNKND